MKKDQAENLEARRVAFWEEQEENYIMNSSPRRKKQELEGLKRLMMTTKFQEEQKKRISDIEKWEHGVYGKYRAAYITKYTKPEGVTKTQWEKEMRRKRQEIRQKRKEQELDQNYEYRKEGLSRRLKRWTVNVKLKN